MLGKKLLTVTPQTSVRNVLYGWGSSLGANESFEDGTPFQHRSSPALVGSKSWKSIISSGSAGYAGIDDINRLWFKGNIGLPYKTTPYSWNQISIGNSLTAAIRSDGSLWVWGSAANGGLGLNIASAGFSSPVQVGTSSWSIVSVGSNFGAAAHMTAIRSDGALFTWGLNASGQLGLSDAANRSSPVQVGTSSWTNVVAGPNMTAALRKDGALFTWGSNSSGILGVSGDVYSWIALAPLGNFGTAAIRSDGTLWGWGNSANLPAITYDSWTKISAGFYGSMAIRSDGTLWGWGYNNTGELGTGDKLGRSSPSQIGTSSWTMVDMGPEFTDSGAGAIRADGTLWMWGSNNYGSLGQSDTVHRSSPVQVGTSSWTTVSNNGRYAAAIRSDGALFTWGYNNFGQLGQDDLVSRSSPVQVGTSSWIAIAAAHGSSGGAGTTFAIRSDGTLWGWGGNGHGQLGQNDQVHRSSPVQVGTDSWTSVSVGLSNVAAIRSDGTLWAWGYGQLGTLGQNDRLHRSSPVQVGTDSWTAVSLAGLSALAKRSDGTLWSWGTNQSGGLGQNDTAHRSSPVQIGTGSWAIISAGASRGIAIDSTNSLYVWGDGTMAGNGMYEQVHRSSPVQLPTYNINGRSSPVQLFAGSWTSIIGNSNNIAAIRSDGTLWGWGTNTLGMFGTNDQLRRFLPTQIMPGSWAQVSIGGSSLVARRNDGTLWATGGNDAGQLGLNDRAHRSSPVQIGTSSWTSVAVGGSHTAAIFYDGTLWAWGNGTNGAVGDGTIIYRSSPVQIGTSSWTKVSAGYRHTIAIRSDTTLWGWGGDTTYSIGQLSSVRSSWTTGATWDWGWAMIRNDGALFTAGLINSAGTTGDSVTIGRSSPVQVGTSSWAQVSANASTLYAIRSDGGLFAWGLNNTGQIGDNTIVNKSSPVQIGTSSWSMVKAAHGIGSHVAAIRTDGALFMWGGNPAGQLGQNDIANRSSPVQVGTSSWINVDVGSTMTLAIRSDGTLWSWGDSSSGQLAETVNIARMYKAVTSAFQGKLAIATDGALWVWGINTNGELGLNDVVDRSSPVQVGTSSWTMVSAFPSHGAAAAIRSDGGLFTWGPNVAGKLGQNTTASRSSPVQVGTDSWAMVSTGSSHMAAIRSDGGLFTWGDNTNGQLGQGNTTSLSSPVQVGTSSWTSVDCGHSHTTAIRSDGALFTWGINTNGQLGQNDRVHRSSPVQVGTDSWTSVSAGRDHTLAISNSNQVWAWGLNTNGLLGQNNTTHRSSPVVVGFDPVGTSGDWQYKGSWVAVAAGMDSSLALTADGYAYWWGNNGLGQAAGPFADNTGGGYSRPVQIGWPMSGSFYNSFNGVHDYAKLYSYITKSALSSGAAIGLGKTLFVWGWLGGSLFKGELGLNDTNHRSSPVQLGGTPATPVHRSSPVQIGVGPSGWTKIDAGALSGVLAIRDDYTLWGWGSNSANGWGINSNPTSSPVMVGGKTSWSMVAGAGSNGGKIALDINGKVWAVGGTNQYGALSAIHKAYTTSGTTRLVQSERFSNIVFVTAGGLGNVLLFESDGSVWTVSSSGFNGYATISIGGGPVKFQPFEGYTNISRSSPVQIDSGIGGSFTGWSDISCPTNFVNIAKKTDGSIWVWGSNQQGVAGINDGSGSSVNSNIPTFAVNYVSQANNASTQANDKTRLNFYSWSFLPSSCIEQAIGHNTVGAIRSDGALFMWGGNANGQLGDGTLAHRSAATQVGIGGIATTSSPIQVGTSSWTQIFAPTSSSTGTVFPFMHAIRSDGSLWTWGNNAAALAGGAGTVNRYFKSIGLTGSAAFVIDVNDEFYAWGSASGNENGQTDQTFGARSYPVQIASGTLQGFFVKRAFGSGGNGGGNAIVQLQNGEWAGWGSNKYGQLLLSPNTTLQTPNIIPKLETKQWSLISPGKTTYGITTDGILWGWGKGTFNAFLNDSDISMSSPVQVGTSSWTFVQTADNSTSGNRYTIALRSDGTLWAWGTNSNGELGQNDLVHRSSPVQIGTSSWTSISAGQTHVAAIRSDGALFVWGNNASGQAGQNDLVHRSSPVQVGTSSWTAVSVGPTFTFARRADGTIWTWGDNFYGQLGQNNVTLRSSPVQVGTKSDWTQIVAGTSMAAAINSAGIVYIWGAASNGISGDETNTSKSSPVMIAAPINGSNRSSPVIINAAGEEYDSWSMVASNGSTIHAIRADNRLYGSGSGTNGQLGDNTTLSRYMFRQIGTNSWSSIAAGTHPIGTQINGTIWTWGNGSVGGLGDSLGPEHEWSQISISSGGYVAGAIRADGALFTWGADNYSALGQNTNMLHRSSPTQVGTSSWTALSVSFNNSLAIRSDGALFTWGYNGNGELGLNDRVHRSSPVQVGTSSWIVVSSAYASALNGSAAAIRADGGLFTWGQDLHGSAGHNTWQVRRSSPTQVGTSSWTFVSYNGASTCVALRADGGLFAWGDNKFGTLGQNDLVHRSSPVQIGTSSWTAVWAGDQVVLAIRLDGALFAWGNGGNGVLGQNSLNSFSSPVQIGTSSWIAVSGAGATAHAIRADGTLWGWGINTDGVIGDKTVIARSSPVQVGPIYNKFTKISTAASTYGGALAIDTNNRLWVWGSFVITPRSPSLTARSSPTQVGADYPFISGGSVYRSSPVLLGGGSSWTSLTAHGDTYGAILNGKLYTWGSHGLGRTGTGLAANHRSAPQQVGSDYYFNEGGAFRNTNTGSWAMISSTYGNHYGGIKTDGSLWLWGWNGEGQSSPQYRIWYGVVSSGAGNALSSPTQLGTSSWSVVSTGETHTAAIRSDGTLWVWGFNSLGQVGDNTTIHRSSPLQVGTSSWISVAAGTSQTAAVRSDGTLWVWGANFNGELGQNNTIHRSSPVQVGTATSWKYVTILSSNILALGTGVGNLWSIGGSTGLNIAATTPLYSWTKVSVGGSHNMAIRSDGTLWVWGAGTDGALGLSDTVHRSSPTQVGTSSWTQIVAGRGTGYAIRSDGTLWAWGLNTMGQLGQSDLVARSSPVQVGTSSWTAVTAFATDRSTVLAIRYDGRLFAWGDNAIGLLGQNDLVHRSSPVQIGTSSWTQVATSLYSAGGVGTALARRSDGGLFAWGMNTNGDLGQNDRVHRSSPVQIGTSSWTQLAVRGTAAIRSDGALFMWGLNIDGQLGQNDLVNRSSPVQVGTSSWTAVTSMQATAAIRSDGTLFMWGYGRNSTFPTLGRHDGISRSSPVQIVSAGTSTWSSLDAFHLGSPFGAQRTIAIGTNGLLYAWGDNANGQLGLNNTLNTFPGYFMPTVIGSIFATATRSSPVQVTAQDSWVWIGSGTIYSNAGMAIAQKSDGTLWAWGSVLNRPHAIPYYAASVSFSSPVQIVGTGVGTSWAITNPYLGLFPATIGTPSGALLSI